MRETKYCLLARPFGDFEALRAYLDDQARQGWELTGRAGLFLGRLSPTRRKELRYDVFPAHPQRTGEVLQAQLRRREEAGWTPIDTAWGMDLYKSLPCREPELFRSEEDWADCRSALRAWLASSLLFALVTLLSLLTLFALSGLGPAEITDQWYLSDAKTALVLSAPLLAALGLLWLGWLLFSLHARTKAHRPAGRAGWALRTGLQLLAIFSAALLPVLLWLSQIPRLWLKLALLVLFLLLPLLTFLPFRGDRVRQVKALGLSVLALFALTMVLGWTLSPLSFSTYGDGNRWRQREDIPTLTAEDLSLEPEGQVTAFYQQKELFLLTAQHYGESWAEGPSIEVSVYRPHLPGLAARLWQDLVPAGAVRTGRTASLHREGWHQLWVLEGDTLYHLSGSPDWSEQDLGRIALELLSS